MTVAVPPIFIVGAPRSGTTLLAAMIGSHRHYAIGPESQFFSKLTSQDLAAAVGDPHWPKRAVAMMSHLTLAGQNVLELFGITPQSLAQTLAAREPSVKAMLEAICVPFAEARGKPGWAEKTPNHLLNLPAIRREWPEARIVRIMRDPRDAALSTCKLPTFSNRFSANLYLWRQWQDTARHFLATDRLSATIRYESMVADPASELRALCAAIDIPFDPAMCDFSSSAADVSSAAETWKKPVSGALDPSRLFAWKKTLSAEDRRLADNVAAEYLAEFGYEADSPVSNSRTAYRMSPEFVERYETIICRDLARGTRWLPADDPARADIVVEHPPYYRTRNPLHLARLAYGRLRFAGIEGLR